ncbi:NAD-binding protein, partial [Myxococcota bacterium]
QVGEFAFVLSRAGRELGLIDGREYQAFLAASVLTMVLTPGLLFLGQRLSLWLPQTALVSELGKDESSQRPEPTQHVIVAGYGVNGQNLARALSATDVPYVILEMNPETVRKARERGEPIHFGDCTRAAVLHGLGVQRARMYVVAISDAASARQSVSLARSLNPELYIVVRTRFVAEIEELLQLGANEVIPEEFETSIEIFARVLHRFDVPRNVVQDLVQRVRGDMYEMLRSSRSSRKPVGGAWETLEGVEAERLAVREGSPAVGRTLTELALRTRTGASVIAVHRAGGIRANPNPDLRLEVGDVLVVIGEPSATDAALTFLEPSTQQLNRQEGITD